MIVPADLYGSELIKKIRRAYGYEVANQVGSHIKLKKNNAKPLTIPNHKPLKKGTLKSILEQLAEYENKSVETVLKDLGL